MAELILTDDEKRSPTLLEWDDVSLGRAVKAVAAICDDEHGKHALKATGAAVFLICEAIRSGATELHVKLEGATDGRSDLGNWNVSIERQVTSDHEWHEKEVSTPHVGWSCVVKDSRGREIPAFLNEDEEWMHSGIVKKLQFTPREWRYATSKEAESYR